MDVVYRAFMLRKIGNNISIFLTRTLWAFRCCRGMLLGFCNCVLDTAREISVFEALDLPAIDISDFQN